MGMTPEEKRLEAARLRSEAGRLEQEATQERPLPVAWQVGQRVRYLADKDWGWNKGDIGTIARVRPEDRDKAANEYQVFWVNFGGTGIYWTTPDDVELVIDD